MSVICTQSRFVRQRRNLVVSRAVNTTYPSKMNNIGLNVKSANIERLKHPTKRKPCRSLHTSEQGCSKSETVHRDFTGPVDGKSLQDDKVPTEVWFGGRETKNQHLSEISNSVTYVYNDMGRLELCRLTTKIHVIARYILHSVLRRHAQDVATRKFTHKRYHYCQTIGMCTHDKAGQRRCRLLSAMALEVIPPFQVNLIPVRVITRDGGEKHRALFSRSRTVRCLAETPRMFHTRRILNSHSNGKEIGARSKSGSHVN